MSFEDKLNKRLLSEAPVSPVRQALQRKQAAMSGAKQGPDPDFAAVRKSLRRPMVAMDAAVHKIDQLLNQTQQDPSALADVVTQIEQSFNAIFNPLKAVRSGISDLRKAADTFGAEYVGQKQQQAPAQQQQQQKIEPGVDEDRYLNRIATDVEMANRQEDKMAAAKAGFDSYKSQGGKMNRGEFFRRLVQKLRLPNEQEQEQRRLPNVGASKNYGAAGTRQGELQFKQGRTAPIESYTPTSSQRRMLQEGPNKYYSLGQLPQVPDEDRLINKVVTDIEMVNNINDKKTAFRNGWFEYQQAGGALSHSAFARAVTDKLKMARGTT